MTHPSPSTLERAPGSYTPPPLDVSGVTVRFGALAALGDVHLQVVPGTIHAVIGPNGAGKSTLFNVLSGLYRASSGSVRLGDQELTGLPPHRICNLGMARTFQNMALSAHDSILDNLLIGRHHLTRTGILGAGLRLPKARREARRHEERVREIAGFLELSDLLDQPVGSLPYGVQKRVEMARAVCSEPHVLLLDEPVAGMNAHETRWMAELIADLRRYLGISIVLVEHDMGMVMSLADEVTVLDFGRLVASGPPAQISQDPNVIRAYLGDLIETDPDGPTNDAPEVRPT